MSTYFEQKKRLGLIFTLHNTNPKLPYISMDQELEEPIVPPDGPNWWSHLSGRYRDYDEQMKYIADGLVDKKLPPKTICASA